MLVMTEGTRAMTNISMPTLNIIGCGRLGKTLARLWQDNNLLTTQQVLNTSLASGKIATEFIGSGTAAASFTELAPADLWLIASDDTSIAPIVKQLANTSVLRAGDVVFHCSGALSSAILEPANESGATVASAHPMHAFSAPETSLETYPGSYCAVEGDTAAVAALTPLLEGIGSCVITINKDSKLLYHAASVIGSNFLVALLDASLQTFAASGITPEQSRAILRPLVHKMVDSVLDTDPASALTGPIARGDIATVENHLAALARELPEIKELYQVMGRRNTELAQKKGDACPDSLANLFEILSKD